MSLNQFKALKKPGRKDDWVASILEATGAILAYILLEWNRTGNLLTVKLFVPASILVVFLIRIFFPRNISRVYQVAVNDKEKEIEIWYYNPYKGNVIAKIPFQEVKLRINRKGGNGNVKKIVFYPKNHDTFDLLTGRKKFSQEDLNALADLLEKITHVSRQSRT